MKQHSPQFLSLVMRAKQHINEITPQQLKVRIDQQQDFVLIDVREESEWITGHIPTAIHLSKGIIERDIEKQIPDPSNPIVVYCSGGFRSVLAAYNLHQMGYTKVESVVHGLQGWLDSGYTLEQTSEV